MNRLLLAMLLVLTAFPASASDGAGIFGQGRTNVSLVAGNGYAFNNSYLVIGASASYYVIDGLGVGLSLENWSGADPGITKYSPFVQYVIYQASVVQPYLGAFYRHSTISGQSSIDSVGGRAGFYFASGSNVYIGVGMVYESYNDCANAGYTSCSSTYPEITLAFGF
jgi:hypothetical protein